MKLRVIGCTGSTPGPDSPASCYLLQAWGHAALPGDSGHRQWSILLDLGSGSFGELLRYLNPAQLDAVIFSHLHADHVADLSALQVYCRWARPYAANHKGPPLRILGPGDIRQRLRELEADPHGDYSNEFAFEQIGPEQDIHIGPFQIHTSLGYHPIENLALRIVGPSDCGQDSVIVTYTGDSDLCQGLVQAAAGCDLLLSEMGFGPDSSDHPVGIHMSASQVANLASSSGTKRLVVTHLQLWNDNDLALSQVKRDFLGPTERAFAGAQYLV